jgi:hypothetical protein
MDANSSGTISVAPDFVDLLTSGGWSAQGAGSSTATCDGSNTHTATYTDIGVDDSTGFVAKDCLVVTVSGTPYLRSVVSAPSGTSIRVEPPLLDINGDEVEPSSGDAVVEGLSYVPNDSRDDDTAVTLWGTYNRHTDVVTGAFPTSEAWSMEANATPGVTFTGSGKYSQRFNSADLDTAINDTITTVIVTEPVVDSRVDSANPAYIGINAEVMKVTAVSADLLTLTVVRGDALGGSAASHSQDDEVFIYRPATTLTTSKIAAHCGSTAVYNGIPLRLTSASVDIDWGVQPHPQHLGSCDAVPGYSAGGKRSISVSAEGLAHFFNNTPTAMFAQARTSAPLLIQVGSASGKMLGFYFPSVRFDEPPSTTDDMVAWSFAGRAYGTSITDPSECILLIG